MGLMRVFKRYSETSKVMTSKVKCLRNFSVLKFSQNIFLKYFKSKTMHNFLCAINIVFNMDGPVAPRSVNTNFPWSYSSAASLNYETLIDLCIRLYLEKWCCFKVFTTNKFKMGHPRRFVYQCHLHTRNEFLCVYC